MAPDLQPQETTTWWGAMQSAAAVARGAIAWTNRSANVETKRMNSPYGGSDPVDRTSADDVRPVAGSAVGLAGTVRGAVLERHPPAAAPALGRVVGRRKAGRGGCARRDRRDEPVRDAG